MLRSILIAAATIACLLQPVQAEDDLDARHAAVMAVLDAFMESFNAMDHDAHVATYHFPHVRIAGGQIAVSPSAEDYPRDYFERVLIPAGWHHSAWVEREIVQTSADKVHVATIFRRHRADGSVLAEYHSLYILARIDRRWGVQGRSSFAP